MTDSAMQRLARQTMARSLALREGESVLIDVVGRAEALTEAMIEAACEAGARPYLNVMPVRHLKSLIGGCTEEQFLQWAEMDRERLRTMNAYVGIRADDNIYEMTDVPEDRYDRYVRAYLQPKQMAMARLGRWVLLRSPTVGMAQLAGMSLDACTGLYYRACGLNYERFAELARPLCERLSRTDRVRIVAPGTDLSFSIRGMGHMVCDGRFNLPDGELFTAPRIDSAEGIITFNVPASYMGIVYENVSLRFRRGVVTDASCSVAERTGRLQAVLKLDEGASRIGEFGIGLNPHIDRPMNNVLFDEKMRGSLHLALGQAYPMADNGNESSVHWDLVLSQTKASGGGALFFDDELIRKDGLFLPPDLQPLDTWRGE
ncbi:aminopeptidase [Paenibacillus elgii]|uniref:aminopeptidase n=1 Tax=Paenibacillus elgii TaxID=189691 RepID=UPI0013D2FF18|nr:aminopeptidase [Paenibacillus elgii]